MKVVKVSLQEEWVITVHEVPLIRVGEAHIVAVQIPIMPGKHSWCSLQLKSGQEELAYAGLAARIFDWSDDCVWVQLNEGQTAEYQLTVMMQKVTRVFDLDLKIESGQVILSHSFTKNGQTFKFQGWPTFTRAATD